MYSEQNHQLKKNIEQDLLDGNGRSKYLCSSAASSCLAVMILRIQLDS
jgi:hypothetical protein